MMDYLTDDLHDTTPSMVHESTMVDGNENTRLNDTTADDEEVSMSTYSIAPSN